MESVDFHTGPDLVSYILETHIYLLNMYPKSEFKRIKKLRGQSLLEWNRTWVQRKKDTQLMASSSPALWDSQKASRCLPSFFAPSPCFLVWLAYGGSDFFPPLFQHEDNYSKQQLCICNNKNGYNENFKPLSISIRRLKVKQSMMLSGTSAEKQRKQKQRKKKVQALHYFSA